MLVKRATGIRCNTNEILDALETTDDTTFVYEFNGTHTEDAHFARAMKMIITYTWKLKWNKRNTTMQQVTQERYTSDLYSDNTRWLIHVNVTPGNEISFLHTL